MCCTCWRKRKERRKSHLASVCDREKHTWVESWSKRAFRPLSDKHKWELQLEEVQPMWRNREKHSESVREWKRKRRYFSLLKLHTRKINWWSSHAVFECYNHREFRPFLCKFQSEQVTQKRKLQLRGAVRKIERNTVSVREWKRKMRHFFFAQVTHKEDKLVVFSWSFWVQQP